MTNQSKTPSAQKKPPHRALFGVAKKKGGGIKNLKLVFFRNGWVER